MLKVVGHQEGGYTGQFADTTVAGNWKWDLLGPAPQTVEKSDGGDVEFLIDESVDTNLGEYTLSLQRLDSAGSPLGSSFSSESFIIAGEEPPQFITIEVASPLSVTITKI